MINVSAAAGRNAADLVRHLRRMPGVTERGFAARLQMRHPAGDHAGPWLRALFREPFEPLTATGKVSAYALADTDHVVLCDDLSLDLVNRAIERLSDGLPAPDEDGGDAEAGSVRVSWFDLSRGDERSALVRTAADAAAAEAQANEAPLRPISAADLPGLAPLLTADRLSPLLRRRRALHLRSATDIRSLYTEIAVSISALAQALASGIDVHARPALFRCLGDRLDRAVLAAFTGPAGPHPVFPAETFSLGLDLATLATPEFAAFASLLDASSGRTPRRALIKIRLDDVLADFDAFAAGRDRLHSQGLRVVLDGLSPAILDALDPSGFGADFVKIGFRAHDRGGDGASPMRRLSEAFRRIGRERLIFADLDTEAMVTEALDLGVRRFQGGFVDTLIATLAAKERL